MTGCPVLPCGSKRCHIKTKAKWYFGLDCLYKIMSMNTSQNHIGANEKWLCELIQIITWLNWEARRIFYKWLFDVLRLQCYVVPNPLAAIARSAPPTYSPQRSLTNDNEGNTSMPECRHQLLNCGPYLLTYKKRNFNRNNRMTVPLNCKHIHPRLDISFKIFKASIRLRDFEILRWNLLCEIDTTPQQNN